MSNSRHYGLLASFLALGCLGVLIGAEPSPAILLDDRETQELQRGEKGQDAPEVEHAKQKQRDADERQLKRNCGKKLKNYQYRDGELQGAKERGEADDVISKRQKARDQAQKELCRCLQQFYGVYGSLPAEFQEFEKICFPPVGDPAVPGPGVDPGEPPEPPPAPTPGPSAAQSHPCAAARDAYMEADKKWGGDSATVHLAMNAHYNLCACIKAHYGGNLPPEWVQFCKDYDHITHITETPELPIYIFPPTNPKMRPIVRRDPKRPAEDDPNRTDSPPPPQPPGVGTPGGEPRSLAPGECEQQRRAYGQLLQDYKKATGAERGNLRGSLGNAYRDLCECLRITAPADYARFCQWAVDSGEPPDLPATWPPVSTSPAVPLPPAPKSSCRPEGSRVFQWVVVLDDQNSARFVTEIPNPLAIEVRRESPQGEVGDVRYNLTIPGQPLIPSRLDPSNCTLKASWKGPAARRQNRPYDLTLTWRGGTVLEGQGELTVEPRDNVPRDIVRLGLTEKPGP